MSREAVIVEDIRRLIPNESRHSWTPVDLVGLAADPPPPPTISGLAYPARKHVFSGEPESLKSWTALVLAVEEIRADHSVVYVDFEMGHREMLARLRNLGLGDEEIADGLIYLEPSEPLTDRTVLADVTAMLEARRPSLVVVDAFTGALEIHGLDPNSGADVEKFYRLVANPLRADDAAIVLLDHVTKAKEGRGKFSIGSERKVGGADVHLSFEAVRPLGRGKTGIAKILTLKDRPGYLPRPKTAEIEFTSDATTHAISWEIRAGEDKVERPFRPTFLMERVSRYVEGQPDRPSRNAVENGVSGNRSAVRLAIDILLAEDFLADEEGPRRARLLHSIRPYREADDVTSPTSPDFASTSPGARSPTTSPTSPTPLQGGRGGEGRDQGELMDATSPNGGADDDIPF